MANSFAPPQRAGGAIVPFGEAWRSHEEARRWALKVLGGRVTFAADGSQVFPGREASVPVAAVQVASFENPHTPDGRYLFTGNGNTTSYQIDVARLLYKATPE